MLPESKSILFFDGECGLCNRTVRFLIKRDRHRRLYFAPLQGVAAKAIVPLKYRQMLSTVVYHPAAANRKLPLKIRSEAVLLALMDIGGIWHLIAQCARLLPLQFRDWCYDRIANNRRHFFKQATCKLPTRKEHERILP